MFQWWHALFMFIVQTSESSSFHFKFHHDIQKQHANFLSGQKQHTSFWSNAMYCLPILTAVPKMHDHPCVIKFQTLPNVHRGIHVAVLTCWCTCLVCVHRSCFRIVVIPFQISSRRFKCHSRTFEASRCIVRHWLEWRFRRTKEAAERCARSTGPINAVVPSAFTARCLRTRVVRLFAWLIEVFANPSCRWRRHGCVYYVVCSTRVEYCSPG